MVPVKEQPLIYCDPCHGIAPIQIKAPRDFFAAQTAMLAAALVVLLLVL